MEGGRERGALEGWGLRGRNERVLGFKGLVLIGHQPPSVELCTSLLGLGLYAL
nr:hypothetical protein Q903MT_gene2858 [Picea sitchensis]